MLRVGLTPKFSCKHTFNIAAKPHPKSACQLQRSLDRGLDEDRNSQQVVGAHQRTRAHVIAYADNLVDTTTGGLPIQIEIEFLTNAWHDGESHSAECLPTR